MASEGSSTAPLWIADWSDSEDEDFRAACVAAGVEFRIVRTRPLGASVGTRLHRLYSWPSYTVLALKGVRSAGNATLVSWQPNAGALAAFLRRRGRPPLLLLNPLLDASVETLRQRVLAAGASRADRVLFFSRSAMEIACSLGLPRSRLGFVPLGVKASPRWMPPSQDHLLAFGRSSRDWSTLAQAARGLPHDVFVVGPEQLAAEPPLKFCHKSTGRGSSSSSRRHARSSFLWPRPNGSPASLQCSTRCLSAGLSLRPGRREQRITSRRKLEYSCPPPTEMLCATRCCMCSSRAWPRGWVARLTRPPRVHCRSSPS